jgi:hypothetical protein
MGWHLLDGQQPRLFEHRREILRAIWTDTYTDGYSNCDSDSYADRHTHTYSNDYAEDNSNTEASPDTATATNSLDERDGEQRAVTWNSLSN